MEMVRSSVLGWISITSVTVCILCGLLIYVAIHRGSSQQEEFDVRGYEIEESAEDQIDKGRSNLFEANSITDDKPTMTNDSLHSDDPHVACEGVQWWKVESEEMISESCFDALENKYLDADSGKFTFSGMSFGKTITYRRIFGDPVEDRELVLQALQRSDCWADEEYWDIEARRQHCHSNAFVSYGISLRLCQKVRSKTWRNANSLQGHWVKAMCQRKDELIDETAYFEDLVNSQLPKLMEKYYGQKEVRPFYNALLLLAMELLDETAVGLSFNDGELGRTFAWKKPLFVMKLVPNWENLGASEDFKLPDIDHRRAIEIAVDVAVGLEELGVEPNWQNLVEQFPRWVTSTTDTHEEAIKELRSTFDPINDQAKLRALNKLECSGL